MAPFSPARSPKPARNNVRRNHHRLEYHHLGLGLTGPEASPAEEHHITFSSNTSLTSFPPSASSDTFNLSPNTTHEHSAVTTTNYVHQHTHTDPRADPNVRSRLLRLVSPCEPQLMLICGGVTLTPLRRPKDTKTVLVVPACHIPLSSPRWNRLLSHQIPPCVYTKW